jgi:hypothetical protein
VKGFFTAGLLRGAVSTFLVRLTEIGTGSLEMGLVNRDFSFGEGRLTPAWRFRKCVLFPFSLWAY